MKTERKTPRINHIFLTITLVLWCWAIGSASAQCPDLIVNGDTQVVDGGCYGIILVRNNGNLTINGNTTADAVALQWGTITVNGNLDVADYITVQVDPTGTMTVNGDVSANRVSIEGGTLTMSGTLHDVSQITLQSGKLTIPKIGSSKGSPIDSVTVESGELHLCGNWFVNDMRINGGVVYVISYSSSLEGSGQFFLECGNFALEEEASINANAAGGDTRGICVDGDCSGGGGYGGKGGKGDYQVGGNIYGDNFSLTIEMGSRGGNSGSDRYKGGKGGGSISIISTGVAINGTITANGGNGEYASGGGSGGGVLIHSTNFALAGSITTSGGKGGICCGGGGGGRIKLFYVTGFNINDAVSELSVNGGARGSGNTQDGQNGTIWTNAQSNPPELSAPEDGTSLDTRRPTFKFDVIDTSVDTDNRDDDLSCIVELSVDNFATIFKTYDQNVSLSGWSKFSYNSGDEAEFTPTVDLPEGVYQWRAAVRDRVIRGDYSAVRSFTLGTPPTIELKASPSSLPPDGESTSLITATVTSHEGDPVTDEVVVMNLNGDGTLSEVTNEGDGMYTATYIAGTTPGTVTITATATNSNVFDTVELTLTSGPEVNIGDTSGDGTISAYDAALILQYVVGIISEFPADQLLSPTDATPRDYAVSLPKLSTTAGRTIQVPIAINDATGLMAGGITLKYDPTILRAKMAVPLPLLSGSYWQASTERNGEVRFAFASPNPSSDNGELFYVEFETLPGKDGAVSPIILDDVQLTESRSIERIHGSVTILPSESILLQNYPNPFNPETWIPFKLAQSAQITIDIYDVAGQRIRTLQLGEKPAGVYVSRTQAAYWDGRNNAGERVASGIYFYRLNAGDFTAMRRMAILK